MAKLIESNAFADKTNDLGKKMKKKLFILFITGLSVSSFALSSSEFCGNLEKKWKRDLGNLSSSQCHSLVSNPFLRRHAGNICREMNYAGQKLSTIAYFCKKKSGKYQVDEIKKQMCQLPQSILRIANSEQEGENHSWLEACDLTTKKHFSYPYSVSRLNSTEGPKGDQAAFSCSMGWKDMSLPGLEASAKVDTGQESLEWLSFKRGKKTLNKDVCLAKSRIDGHRIVNFVEFDALGRTASNGQSNARSGFCIESEDQGKDFCLDVSPQTCRSTANLMEYAKLVYGPNLDKDPELPWAVSFNGNTEAQRVLMRNLQSFGRSQNSFASLRQDREPSLGAGIVRSLKAMTSIFDLSSNPSPREDYDSDPQLADLKEKEVDEVTKTTPAAPPLNMDKKDSVLKSENGNLVERTTKTTEPEEKSPKILEKTDDPVENNPPEEAIVEAPKKTDPPRPKQRVRQVLPDPQLTKKKKPSEEVLPAEDQDYRSLRDVVDWGDDPDEDSMDRSPQSLFDKDIADNDSRKVDYLSRLMGKEDFTVANMDEWESLVDDNGSTLKIILEHMRRQCELAGHSFTKSPIGLQSPKKSGAAK